jgi:hypothetical protein
MSAPISRREYRLRAEQAPVFEALNSQWEVVATSRSLRWQLRGWAARHPVLVDYFDGESLMSVLHDVSAVEELRRELLEAVAAEAVVSDLAMTVTLRALLPRLASLVNRSAGAGVDLDDRCAMVLLIAHETVVKCRPGTARSWYDRRLWCNISKRYYRWVTAEKNSIRIGSEVGWTSVEGGDQGVGAQDPTVVSALTIKPEPMGEDLVLAELCDWVAEQARLDLSTARLVVLTRAGGVPVQDLVGATGASAQSIRRRRLRAEQLLAQALEVA